MGRLQPPVCRFVYWLNPWYNGYMIEELKELKEYPGLYVTVNGDVYSNTRGPLIKLRQCLAGGGYPVISYKNVQYKVHRLVGLAFIPNPDNHPVINHKDGVRNNNAIDNLEWVTIQRNVEHGCAEHFLIEHIESGNQFVAYNLRKWCRDNKISRCTLMWTLTGKRDTKQTKGYRLLGKIKSA